MSKLTPFITENGIQTKDATKSANPESEILRPRSGADQPHSQSRPADQPKMSKTDKVEGRKGGDTGKLNMKVGQGNPTNETRDNNAKSHSQIRSKPVHSENSNSENRPRDSYRRHSQSSNRQRMNSESSNRDRQNSSRRANKKTSGINLDPSYAAAVGRTKGEKSLDVTIDESFYKQKEDRKKMYQTIKCLIIHDPYFDQIDKDKFSKWYDIETMRYETLLSVVSDTSLPSKINKICPEVVYLHVGQADILNKSEGNKVVDCMKRLIRSLMASTNAKLCISLIIPLSNHVPQVQSITRQVNRELANFVSDLRKNTKGEAKIFTQNNDALGGFIQRTIGKHGVTVSLNERGQRKMWLHLKDALIRILRDVSKGRSSERNNRSNSRLERSRSDHE